MSARVKSCRGRVESVPAPVSMPFHLALPFLFLAGFLAGVMNALAGGGSFISVPAMIATGMPSVLANTSSTVALGRELSRAR